MEYRTPRIFTVLRQVVLSTVCSILLVLHQHCHNEALSEAEELRNGKSSPQTKLAHVCDDAQ